MSEPVRVPPSEARRKQQEGKALLVCGYEESAKFDAMHLDGAISLQDLRSREASLPKDQEIIFYCA